MAQFGIYYSIKENGRNAPNYDVSADLDGSKTLADLFNFTKNSLIVISDMALKEEQAKGFDKSPVRIVDGSFTKSVSQVNPLGKIQYVARNSIVDIALFAYDQIRARTKVVTGQYLRNNIVMLNGKMIASTRSELEKFLETNEVKESDIIRFINTAPYARKLERMGVTADRTKSRTRNRSRNRRGYSPTVLVPNGTYALAIKAIKRKYKNNSFIAFRFVSGSDIAGLSGAGRSYKRGASKGRPYLYPSIIIYVKEAGLLQ